MRNRIGEAGEERRRPAPSGRAFGAIRASARACSSATNEPSASAAPPVHGIAMSCNDGITNMTFSSTAATATHRPHHRTRSPRRHRHPDELREPGEAFDEQVRTEHLVDRGQRPQAARAVEVQEVLVGNRAVQHAVGEDEHEALFHGRAGGVQQRAQRQEVRDDRDGDDDPPGAEQPAESAGAAVG